MKFLCVGEWKSRSKLEEIGRRFLQEGDPLPDGIERLFAQPFFLPDRGHGAEALRFEEDLPLFVLQVYHKLAKNTTSNNK